MSRTNLTLRSVRHPPEVLAKLNEHDSALDAFNAETFSGEWTYIRKGDDAGVKADHVTEGVAGTDPADIVVRADNDLFLSGYAQTKIACSADNIVLHAASGIALGSNGDQGCKLTLNATTGRPVFALGHEFASPTGTDAEKITSLIAILNTLGLFTAP